MKASINSVDIAYDDHGMGTPVLFLHAFPLNRTIWTDQINGLLSERHYRLVALDWRGFGDSRGGACPRPPEASPDPYVNDVLTMELLADDVAGLMDTLGMEQAVLCGLSMGGYVTFAFLRKYPQRVRGLILADTRPGTDTDEVKAGREQMALLALSQGTEAVADVLIPRQLSDYTRQHHPLVEQSVRHMINAATPQGIAAASRGMALRADSSDLLSSISCPTLVIVGEKDALTPPVVAREYAARIPGSQFATIPDAGHLSSLEQPEAFLAVVRNFLLASF
jgi:pimeloyl-ACP methyl ester carboxylesterase